MCKTACNVAHYEADYGNHQYEWTWLISSVQRFNSHDINTSLMLAPHIMHIYTRKSYSKFELVFCRNKSIPA